MPVKSQYADSDELETYWRPLSEAEQDRAEDLLGRAAVLINELPGAANFSAAACAHVSLDMVKRAMVASANGEGVTEQSQAMDDMSATQRFANPMGALYLTAREIARLVGPTPPAFSLTPTSNVRVPVNPWTYQCSSQTEDTSG